MNRYLRAAGVGLCLALGFASGWLIEHRNSERKNTKAASSSNSRAPHVDCNHASESDWYTVRGFFYEPSKTLYNADWQYCPGEPAEQRVRITDANFQKVFFHYEDDQVLRLEMLDLLGNHVPQVLVLTMAGGTGDYIGWHVISESNSALEEWKLPDYDRPAEKLLGPDEDFGFKDWNFHMQGNEILLARGVYKKGEGNCCPSRGGVLVRLRPTQNAFKLVGAVRINKPQYYRWRDQPFCLNCRLY
jgi:hypothetical protein